MEEESRRRIGIEGIDEDIIWDTILRRIIQ